MAVSANLFVTDSLVGSTQVKNTFANVNVGTRPLAFIGDQSFVVKLRRNSTEGDVIATTPQITIRDNAALVSFVANTYTVSEGDLVEFTLTTTGAPNNAVLYYSTLDATSNIDVQDFFGSNAGSFTLIDNVGTIVLRANTDGSVVDETGETFKLQIRTGSVTGNVVLVSDNVAILDTSNTSSYFISQTATSVTEGSNVTFEISTVNVPDGTEVFYTTAGNVRSYNFTTGNTGSFIIVNGSNTIDLIGTAIPNNEIRQFALQLREGSTSGQIKATSENIVINDVNLVTGITATGGTITNIDGYRVHSFSSSSNLQISSLSSVSAYNSLEYLVVAGGGGGGGGAGVGNGPITSVARSGAGGGAGGVLIGSAPITDSSANITIVVGAGGIGGAGLGTDSDHGFFAPPFAAATPGGNSVIMSYAIAIGGGGGGMQGTARPTFAPGAPGGSGGGGVGTPDPDRAQGGLGGLGIAGQGFPGGRGSYAYLLNGILQPGSGASGGGGGAGQYGANASPSGTGGKGGDGLSSLITGSNVFYGGGGGGAGTTQPNLGLGGAGGGGAGGYLGYNVATSGNVNTGGGGGGTWASWPPDGGAGSPPASGGSGGGYGYPGKSGGSGIVIVRYPLPVQSTFALTEDKTTVPVNQNITFGIITTNVANNYVLYYRTSGNVISTDFVQGNTGSFAVVNNAANITLTANAVLASGEERIFTFQILEGAVDGDVILVSNTITVTPPPTYIEATGGIETIAGGYKTHIFLHSNVITISTIGSGPTYNTIEYLVVAGGGGGGAPRSFGGAGGGGGAGGLLYSNIVVSPTHLGISNVFIGNGGAKGVYDIPGDNGGNSSIFTIVAIGGGGGGGGGDPPNGVDSQGRAGGSGGGGQGGLGGTGGAGISGQGNPGGNAVGDTSAGGGGAGAAGGPRVGGAGRPIDWIPASYGTVGPTPGRWFAGGGGGGSSPPNSPGAAGGAGGGGFGGGNPTGHPTNTTTAGTINTGGGGGGAGYFHPTGTGQPGGSGIIIIRYPYV